MRYAFQEFRTHSVVNAAAFWASGEGQLLHLCATFELVRINLDYDWTVGNVVYRSTSNRRISSDVRLQHLHKTHFGMQYSQMGRKKGGGTATDERVGVGERAGGNTGLNIVLTVALYE